MESKKQPVIIFGVFFCALALFAAIRIIPHDDKSRIRKIVYAAALAVEGKEALGVVTLFSDSYQDSYGNNKAMVSKIISHILKGYQPFKVDIKQLDIEVKDLKAESLVGFKCYFKKAGDKQIYYDAGKLKLYFQKENSQWKILEINYTGPQELLLIQGVA